MIAEEKVNFFFILNSQSLYNPAMTPPASRMLPPYRSIIIPLYRRAAMRIILEGD